MRSPWLRAALFCVLVVVSTTALLFPPLRELLTPKDLYVVLGRIGAHPAAPFLFLLGFVCLSVLGSPMVPLVVAGAAVFGFRRGLALNYVGLLLGASASYWLARILGRDWFRYLLGSRYAMVESVIRRGGFWAMVRLRFIPIPFPLANLGPALLGVDYATFLASTALAYAPIVAVYSYFAAVVVDVGDAERRVVLGKLTLAVLLLLVLTFVPSWMTRWREGRRQAHLEGKG